MRLLVCKGKKSQAFIQYSTQIFFKNKGKIKTYLDNQKLREFIGSKTTLKNRKGRSSDQQRNPKVSFKKNTGKARKHKVNLQNLITFLHNKKK